MGPPCGQRIGLLGGSFNPAHEGHRYISLIALKRLQLDAVWWLVSPQNPFKDKGAPYAERLAGARALANHPRIRVSDFEKRHNTRYTIDTIKRLQQTHGQHRFVWLMGADNLSQFHRWKAADEIASRLPFAVIDRPGNTTALASRTAHKFARHRLDESDSAILATQTTPHWVFLHTRLHPASSTALRAEMNTKMSDT
ncbi:MAG: nicotinate-nucleotide adenylyltransferase [Alphaproteobacteria bacterium]